MFKNILNAFKVAEVRKRILFTFLMVIVVRLGNQIVTPGINVAFVKSWFESMNNTTFNFFNVITGSSFSTMSILVEPDWFSGCLYTSRSRNLAKQRL